MNVNITELFFLLKFILLGFVQGVTETLPISSNGHSIIIKDILSIQTPGLSFEIIVHIGSLIAVCIFFRSDLLRLLKETVYYIIERESKYAKSFTYTIYLLIATIITGSVGLIIEPIVTTTLSKPLFVGMSLLITGSMLWLIRNLHGYKQDSDITLKDALLIGLAQSVALIPGISRSGATVVTALLVGMKKTTAMRFSFLLFIPVSLGVTTLSLNDTLQDHLLFPLIIPYFLACLTAVITTYFALKWFMHIMQTGKLKVFAYYCFIVGTITLLFHLIYN